MTSPEKYSVHGPLRDFGRRRAAAHDGRPSIAVFAARVAGRIRRPLGDLFSLRNLGVNFTRLPPGVQSALLHRHSKQDELVYISKAATLVTEAGETELAPGMCAGFAAGGVRISS